MEVLLYAIQEVSKTFTEFSPFELLYQDVLDVIIENWEEGLMPNRNEDQKTLDLRAKLHTWDHLVQDNLLLDQERHKQLYNRH